MAKKAPPATAGKTESAGATPAAAPIRPPKKTEINLRVEKLRIAKDALFKSVGLSFDGSHVSDKAIFKKAGGSIPPDGPALWKFDVVMAEIAAATPEAGQAIIKRLGINWK